jgi:hypothetical protein
MMARGPERATISGTLSPAAQARACRSHRASRRATLPSESSWRTSSRARTSRSSEPSARSGRTGSLYSAAAAGPLLAAAEARAAGAAAAGADAGAAPSGGRW